jgi:hypothetical protein
VLVKSDRGRYSPAPTSLYPASLFGVPLAAERAPTAAGRSGPGSKRSPLGREAHSPVAFAMISLATFVGTSA